MKAQESETKIGNNLRKNYNVEVLNQPIICKKYA